jgi:hypothetical protein
MGRQVSAIHMGLDWYRVGSKINKDTIGADGFSLGQYMVFQAEV